MSAENPPDLPERLQACLHRLEHILPAQAPLRDFVHHNTLHGFQHLPFAQALGEAGRLLGANPWFDEAHCRALFAQRRVTADDLAAALAAMPEADPERPLLSVRGIDLRRGDVLLAALLHPPHPVEPAVLRWQEEEGTAAGTLARLLPDLDPAVRARLLAAGEQAGLRGEAALVADLWSAAREVLGLREDAGAPAASLDTLFDIFPEGEAPAAPPWEKGSGARWQALVARLGRDWTWGALLAWLTGEDVRQALHPTLVRHLAAHLDQGVAAWRNPASGEGFYAAWRHSAALDWAWPLDELPGARHAIDELPADALSALIGELERLGPDEAHWCAYLERLALELPGWSGMFAWREQHAAASPNGPPVALLDYLAVRLVLERLYAERLVREIWQQPLLLSELGEYFVCHPAELWLRDLSARGELPETLQDEMERCRNAPSAPLAERWERMAHRLADWQDKQEALARRGALAARPLFLLAQRLGLCGGALRDIGESGARLLLRCAGEFSAGDESDESGGSDRRGYAWLLAYEHHYRQQLFAALAANHGRAAPPAAVAAQMIFCMDDREEGTRRHLEEVNPAIVTFGAAGFFGLPLLWQGLADRSPSALCPVVVRPANALREEIGADDATAQAARARRRRWLQGLRERLHQGTRRGVAQSAVLLALAAPGALCALLGRTLAPARFGALSQRAGDAWFTPLPGRIAPSASDAEAGRAATPEAPRQGFTLAEQVERLGAFLRGIGLISGFAPLVVLLGHGSDSRNNPHLAAYDCGACSGRHGGPNARVFAALANRPELRAALAESGIVIPASTWFLGAEHNTCDETVVWYDSAALPESHRAAFAALCRDTSEALRRHAVERCRRLASAPRRPSPEAAMRHLAGRRQDIGQSRPELGHATIAAAFVGRRAMSRGAFFDRRVFLISYDPSQDGDGRILEATLLAAGPVGAGISLEYYFSTVDNERFGCGTKIMHNLTGLFGVMEGASSDLRTGLPRQMIEIHEPMRLLVVAEQTTAVLDAILARQPALRELVGNGWIVLAAKHPERAELALYAPESGWRAWAGDAPALPRVARSADWFAGHDGPLPPALLAGLEAAS